MKQNDDEKALDRRGFLQCMAWVGTGAMWTLTSGGSIHPKMTGQIVGE